MKFFSSIVFCFLLVRQSVSHIVPPAIEIKSEQNGLNVKTVDDTLIFAHVVSKIFGAKLIFSLNMMFSCICNCANDRFQRSIVMVREILSNHIQTILITMKCIGQRDSVN